MIDYIYSDCEGIAPKDFLANGLLEFHTGVSLRTGEISSIKNIGRNLKRYPATDERIASYKQCEFIVTNEKYINFSGSLHRYFNNGDNSTDFRYYDLFTAIKDRHQKCKINPFLDQLHNVEFAVNVLLPFNTQTLIKAINSFKGREYELRQYGGKGNCIKFVFDQYELKIYDKGHQKGLKKNLLRFEIKVTTMHFLRAKGIALFNSAGLLNPAIHEALGKLLVEFWNQLIIYDSSINVEEAKPRERIILIEGQNPKYWAALHELRPEVYKKRLKRFKELNLRYGKLNPQKIVSDLIQNNWRQLSQIEPKELKEVNDFLAHLQPQNIPQNKRPIASSKKQIEKTNFPQNNRLRKSGGEAAINENFPQNNTSNSSLHWGTSGLGKRVCKSCGRDISNQKAGSKFCSEMFVDKKAAKRCHNAVSNPRNHLKERAHRRYGTGYNLVDLCPKIKAMTLWTEDEIIFKDYDEDGFSAIWGKYRNGANKVLGIRWPHKDPEREANPVYTVIPSFLTISILEKILTYSISNYDTYIPKIQKAIGEWVACNNF